MPIESIRYKFHEIFLHHQEKERPRDVWTVQRELLVLDKVIRRKHFHTTYYDLKRAHPQKLVRDIEPKPYLPAPSCPYNRCGTSPVG